MRKKRKSATMMVRDRIRRVAVLTDISRGFGKELLLGIARYASIHGHWELLTQPPSYLKSGKHKAASDWLFNLNIDGVIVGLARNSREIAVADLPAVANLPAVVEIALRDEWPDRSYIEVDNVEVARMGVEYLINRGFRQLAYCGFCDFVWEAQRFESFQRTCAAHGCEVYFYERPKSRVLRSVAKEHDYMADWLQSLPKPMGLMASNDDRARQVLDACKAADILVPEEIAVLGVDNDELLCSLAHPPLSSINLNARKGGYEAAELLEKLMSEKQMANQEIMIMPTHVVTRQSTDIMAISDREVANALRFIRDHSGIPIQVADVAHAVAMTIRSLDRRFHSVLGRSVFQEISSVRMEHLSRLLVETDWPISRIAPEAGFSDAAHMVRRFRKMKGMTPLAYRKKYGTNVGAH